VRMGGHGKGRQWPEPDRPHLSATLGLSLWLNWLSLVVHFIGVVMKNIAVSGTWPFAIPGGNIIATIVDIDRACIWIASERLNADADTELDIYKKGLPGDPHETEM
jgi:hypothetical protein